MTAVMIPAWTISIKKIKTELPAGKLPLLGVAGHAVGGTLTALLVGPYGACISISVALLLQALLFGDGGILAFGANCFNMAFVMPFVGYAVYFLISGKRKASRCFSAMRQGMRSTARIRFR